jgi:hypothetical protein
MPTLQGISLELHTQQGPTYGGPIEEFAPRETGADDPSSLFMPPIYNVETRIVSVFIPIFPSQQFWLVYSTHPPIAPSKRSSLVQDPFGIRFNTSSPLQHDGEFYVFKLFIGSDELTTWSCGAEQDWRGKTVFGMFDTGTSTAGKGLQKRIMCFGSQGPLVSGDLGGAKDEDRKIEVRVYRANQALRVPRQTGHWDVEDKNLGGVRSVFDERSKMRS